MPLGSLPVILRIITARTGICSIRIGRVLVGGVTIARIRIPIRVAIVGTALVIIDRLFLFWLFMAEQFQTGLQMPVPALQANINSTGLLAKDLRQLVTSDRHRPARIIGRTAH